MIQFSLYSKNGGVNAEYKNSLMGLTVTPEAISATCGNYCLNISRGEGKVIEESQRPEGVEDLLDQASLLLDASRSMYPSEIDTILERVSELRDYLKKSGGSR